MQTLGKTSLMVYWVHVVLVYGRLFEPWKKVLPVRRVTAVTVGVTMLMFVLSIARLRWAKRRRRASAKSKRRRPGHGKEDG